MKKAIAIVSLILVFATTFSIMSCNNSHNKERENITDLEGTNESEKKNEIETTIEEEENREIKDVNYLIYADVEYNGTPELLPDVTEGKQINIISSHEKIFNLMKPQKSYQEKDFPSVKTFTVDKKEYTLEYYKTYETVSFSSEKMKNFSLYNAYERRHEYYVEYNVSTDELTFFMDMGLDLSHTGDLTDDEAKKRAEEIVSELYGSDTLNEYVVTLSFPTVSEGNRTEYKYTVVYTKYVYGLPTSDNIQITMNMLGELDAINAVKKGSLANAEKHLSKEEVDRALEFYNETFPAGEWFNSKPYLTIDSNGDYYIASMVSKNDRTNQIYINIQ
jgi:hypothetical protein